MTGTHGEREAESERERESERDRERKGEGERDIRDGERGRSESGREWQGDSEIVELDRERKNVTALLSHTHMHESM